ncbi:MAG: oligopeptide transporter, OPT family [Gammaproteobacteria bacterium]|nr:oligopeptide transporter, OPT family [Gammaproteobacteria bacterium]MCH9715631.1 oligopeptide transporter, OPT family [Gammaproteobacteria bacterium]MCH9762896.1 oligopeptide transporter, OPT family [Gammaproteobacteria bacterium]
MQTNTPAELTTRSILIGILLTLLLAMSNAYLALKLGILTSASIPAAILSMGILRCFKNPSILENNAVQTAASAGEAIAGGIVYTIPALIIIGYWHHFDYWTNFFIAASGGILGVLFSIPLRRMLVHDSNLRFPEGRAIAEVLKSSYEKASVRPIVYGGLIGASIELAQVGFKLLATGWSHWVIIKKTLLGFGVGFSATMIGAGFLIGRDMAISIMLGAVLAWGLILPGVSLLHPDIIMHQNAHTALNFLWDNHMRYLGIGGMLFAGIWTFLKMARPLIKSIYTSLTHSLKQQHVSENVRVEQDIPMPYILIGILLLAVALFLFFQVIFPLNIIGLNGTYAPMLVLIAVLYVLIIGFLFSVITAYFSGMVGVTASPGSSVVIAGILFAAWLLLSAIQLFSTAPLTAEQLKAAEAITIMIGAMVTGIAAISNDNVQDLKVGQLVGATPWKQQLMLLLGVIISALIIPPVMQLLFDVYGIAGVMPRPGMDPTHSLPAPTAALLAAITEAMFRSTLPWNMMFGGAFVIMLLLVLNHLLKLARFFQLSILGVAIGMYLPLTSSFPLFLGGMLAYLMEYRLNRLKLTPEVTNQRRQIGTLIACGLVAGSALMDVFVAIPFSLMHSPNALALVGPHFEPYAVTLSILVVLGLGYWIIQYITRD